MDSILKVLTVIVLMAFFFGALAGNRSAIRVGLLGLPALTGLQVWLWGYGVIGTVSVVVGFSLLPLIAGFVLYVVSKLSLRRVERVHGHSGIDVQFKPWRAYREIWD